MLLFFWVFFFVLLQQRQNLQIQLAGLQSDYDGLNARYEEEAESANSLRAQLSKVNAEYTALKARFDKELQLRTEELEETRSVIFRRNAVICKQTNKQKTALNYENYYW